MAVIGEIMNFQVHIKHIYADVFCKTYSESYYIFLCGGAGKDCIRNDVRTQLELNGYQILYPEDLFVDIINHDKKSDLLDYENLLAKNADIVCVICESPGSFAELGAFVQSEAIKSRMVAAINYRYRRHKSFIMLGPIRHLKKINADSVLEYRENDISSFCDHLGKSFGKIKRKWPQSHDRLSFDNLSTYIAFLPIMLFFFRELDRSILHKELKEFLKREKLYPSNYNDLFNAAIKYLIKRRIIVPDIKGIDMQEQFRLTDVGLNETQNILSKSKASYSNMLHDKIRCGIMKEQLYN